MGTWFPNCVVMLSVSAWASPGYFLQPSQLHGTLRLEGLSVASWPVTICNPLAIFQSGIQLLGSSKVLLCLWHSPSSTVSLSLWLGWLRLRALHQSPAALALFPVRPASFSPSFPSSFLRLFLSYFSFLSFSRLHQFVLTRLNPR